MDIDADFGSVRIKIDFDEMPVSTKMQLWRELNSSLGIFNFILEEETLCKRIDAHIALQKKIENNS